MICAADVAVRLQLYPRLCLNADRRDMAVFEPFSQPAL